MLAVNYPLEDSGTDRTVDITYLLDPLTHIASGVCTAGPNITSGPNVLFFAIPIFKGHYQKFVYINSNIKIVAYCDLLGISIDNITKKCIFQVSCASVPTMNLAFNPIFNQLFEESHMSQ